MSNLDITSHHRCKSNSLKREEGNAEFISSYEDRVQSAENELPAPPNRVIYPLINRPGWRVTIVPYDPAWPAQFETIKAELHKILTTFEPPATYTTIEHIGSTSIPGLCGKPNIDVLITLPNQNELDKALEAFAWEVPEAPPYVRYTRMPQGGGIQGRESLKLYIPTWASYQTGIAGTATPSTMKTRTESILQSSHHQNHINMKINNNINKTLLNIPQRSVYLINTNPTQNPPGTIQIRNYHSVKQTLANPQNQDLLNEYAKVKWELSTKIFETSTDYARLKDDIIRKILLRGGWSDEEVDLKEKLRLDRLESTSEDDDDVILF